MSGSHVTFLKPSCHTLIRRYLLCPNQGKLALNQAQFGAFTIGVAPEQAHDIFELVEDDDGEVVLESVEDDEEVEHELEEPH